MISPDVNNWMRRLICLWFITLLANTTAFASAAVVYAPPEHQRGEDQTYLTYPEWFLVHSPAEYARFVAEQPPSEFPFFGHIAQFWDAYVNMTKAMGDQYEFNLGYHVMVFVIGTSTTVEYALKAGYEAVFGRMFEGDATPEDTLGALVAQDYVDFILSTPWYEYDYFAQLGVLWLDTPLFGPHLLRKWERRFALTTEYLAKGLYAVLIKAATQAGYDAPIPLTTIALYGGSVEPGVLTDLTVLMERDDGLRLVTVPRYAAFKDYALALALRDGQFEEIAGNNGIIVVSVLTEQAGLDLEVAHDVVLQQHILTEPGRQRFVVRTRVADLAPLLRAVSATGIELEHIYDY